jgi:hypothetical protein
VAENKKNVKAPAQARKNTAESAETKVMPVMKSKTLAGETKSAKTTKTKEVAKEITPEANSGPQRVPSKAKPTPATAPAPTPAHHEIAQLAHRFWKERGGHHGSHEQDWLRAERELRGKAS